MPIPKVVKRELEVAFSKNAQPVWFRVLKYIALAALVYFLWGNNWLWYILGTFFGFGLLLHLWYRYKTNGWNQSYGGWDYEKNKPKG